MTQNTTDNKPGEAQLEPTLDELAIEAAMFLEALPTYVSDNTLCRAGQMAFALRACVENRAPLAAVAGVVLVDREVAAKRAFDAVIAMDEHGYSLLQVAANASANVRNLPPYAAAASSLPAEPPLMTCRCGHVRELHYKQFGPCSGKGCSGCARFVEAQPLQPVNRSGNSS